MIQINFCKLPPLYTDFEVEKLSKYIQCKESFRHKVLFFSGQIFHNVIKSKRFIASIIQWPISHFSFLRQIDKTLKICTKSAICWMDDKTVCLICKNQQFKKLFSISQVRWYNRYIKKNSCGIFSLN